ncbi:site-specific DNA-methyltransferase [Endozoicomonas sp. ALC013]|uniref:site-specific DNA-methyltransferase n=1 Tax=Endozoicomonas sp. ALC013 TaxID=3403076 RepID=UPI003BB59DAF
MEKITQGHHGSLSLDMVQDNISKLKQLFPELITEDASGAKIDVDVLKELVGNQVIDGDKERYNFTWHGKAAARRLAQTPSTGTLRPCKEESKDWDTTQNLFIEGDNLEVLKLLQKSYHKKVKMIYIDPPYNTGREFIYPDNFSDNIKNYLELTGQIGKEGQKLSANPETSGRYHSNWLNMMLPRLRLARNLLNDEGVIFISIDDHEVTNLRRLCDEVFGEENFIASVIWQKVFSPKNSAKYLSEDHDYILIYSKVADIWRPTLLPRSQEMIGRYSNPDNDPRGVWASSDLCARNFYGEGTYSVTCPSGRVIPSPPQGSYWRVSKQNFDKMDDENRLWWGEDGNNMPRMKRFLSEVKGGVVPQTLWKYQDVGHTQEAKKELIEFVEFENTINVLNSVKPTRLLRHALKIGSTADQEDIILDFFSGSAPLAHAVIAQNAEDGGKRKFILVQIPEPLKIEEEKVKTIADLGKSRIRNAGDKIVHKNQEKEGIENLDIGFKVFKLDSSNIKPWDADFDNLEDMIAAADDSLKKDRTADDVLYEILLKYGLDLTLPIEEHILAGKTVHNIGNGALMICLDDEITLDVVNAIGDLKKELQPEVMRVVFKDAGFADPVVKTNAIQVLKQFGIDDVKSI